MAETSQPTKGGSVLEGLSAWDSHWSLQIHNVGLRIPRKLLLVFELSGDGLFWIPVTAALCWAPTFSGQTFFRGIFVAFLFDLLILGAIKGIIRRPRPVYNKGMYVVVSVDHFSFPSGHSSRAFLIMVFVLEYASLWEDIIVSNLNLDDTNMIYVAFIITVILWATLTATSRILLGRHYLLDVVVGSLVGILEAVFVKRVVLAATEDQLDQLYVYGYSLKDVIMRR